MQWHIIKGSTVVLVGNDEVTLFEGKASSAHHLVVLLADDVGGTVDITVKVYGGVDGTSLETILACPLTKAWFDPSSTDYTASNTSKKGESHHFCIYQATPYIKITGAKTGLVNPEEVTVMVATFV